MVLHHRLAVHTVLWCATLLTLTALAVHAQGTDATSVCPGGDGSRPVKLAPADKRTMRVLCDDIRETCSVEVTVVMDEQAATTLCAPVNGIPNTIMVDRAVAVQTEASRDADPRLCSPMLDDPERPHLSSAATFLNDAVRQAWQRPNKGSISTVSICGDPDKDVLVCGSGDVASAKSGESQLCGVAGAYQAVYTGMDTSGTNGCNGNGVRLYFTIVGVPQSIEYSIYNLSFEAPVVTSVVTLNGTQQTVTANASPGVPVSVRVDVVNPLEGHLLALWPGVNRRHVGTSRMQPGSCTGYCAFQRNPEDTQVWSPMSATCTGATPNCQGGVTASSCAADVQLFESSTDDIELPYSTPDDSVRYTLNDENRVVVDLSGSVVPLQGVFVFNQTVADRVTAKGAARDLSRATTQVLRQDAQHKDVVVVRAGGEVATASSACAFALRGVRGTDRMYSVTNVIGGPTCDLVIGNGVEQQTFTLATPAKASGAREVDDYEALWGEVDTVDEGGESNLPLILGLSLGLGVGVLAVIAAIVVGVVCCRRKKACCFADDGAQKDCETGCCACATLCCCCGDAPEDGGDAGNGTAENPLQKSRSPSAIGAPKRLGTASTMQGDSKTDMTKQSDLYSSASELMREPAHANDCRSPEKTRDNTQPAAPVTHKAANGQRSAPHPPVRPSAIPTSSPTAKPAQPIRAAQTPPETPLLGPSIASLRALSPPLAKPAAPPTTKRTTPPTQPTVTTEVPPPAPLKKDATTASLHALSRPVASPIVVPADTAASATTPLTERTMAAKAPPLAPLKREATTASLHALRGLVVTRAEVAVTSPTACAKADVYAGGSSRCGGCWVIKEDDIFTPTLLPSPTEASAAIPAVDSNVDRHGVCSVDRAAALNPTDQRRLSQRGPPARPVFSSTPPPDDSSRTSPTGLRSDARQASFQTGDALDPRVRSADDIATPRVKSGDVEAATRTVALAENDDAHCLRTKSEPGNLRLSSPPDPETVREINAFIGKHPEILTADLRKTVTRFRCKDRYKGDPAVGRDSTTPLEILPFPHRRGFFFHVTTYMSSYPPPERPFSETECTHLRLSLSLTPYLVIPDPLHHLCAVMPTLQEAFEQVSSLPVTEQTHAELYALSLEAYRQMTFTSLQMDAQRSSSYL